MSPKMVETVLAYEWRTAREYLGRANGSHQQAFENLLTELKATRDDSHMQNVLHNVGFWMLRNWPIKRSVGSEYSEREERKLA